MNNPLFSIIAASYNNDRYLPECLDSLINQTYTNIEIVVVDDASTDNLVQIIKQYQQKDKGVGYLQYSIIVANGDSEGSPVVLMEASYSGLPIVATKVGSTDELIINNQSGYLVESKNPEAIFTALKKIIDNHEIWYKFGQQGHEHIKKHYNVNILNEVLIKKYNQLIQKKY